MAVGDPRHRVRLGGVAEEERAGLALELLDQRLSTTPELTGGQPPAPWRPGPPCPPELRGVLGRWWSEAEETVFTWRDGHLWAHLAAAPETSQTVFGRLGPDLYQAVTGRLRGEQLVVKRGDDGVVRQLTWATYPHTVAPR